MVAVSVGAHHAVAVGAERMIFSWGENQHGQLGLGHTDPVMTPTSVVSLAGKSIVKVHIATV